MTKRALLILADGAEEMEVVITVDTLRRAEVRDGPNVDRFHLIDLDF